ncbi:phage portal protein [Agrobacterium tumefaciens]|uniref:phage portal protein n=1 Tax=Agrobacterium tumefaciens TaxID=358 RepID=UPI003BA3B2CC
MGFFERWVGRPIKLTDGEFWRGFFGLGTTSGETVTIESALSLDAVWACVNLVQNAAGTLPCIVYGEDGVTVDKNAPLYELLHDMPNMDDTAPEFWSMAAMCLLLDGNFFAEKKMNGERLVALNPLHPLSVDVCRSKDGRNTRYYEVTEDGKKRRVPEGKMFHVRGVRLPGCDRGMSPIGVVRNTVGSALAGEKVAGRIEAAIYRDLLDAKTRKTTKVKFNMEELLRGDSTARAEFLSKMVTNGIYLVDEARSYEDKAPALMDRGMVDRIATLDETLARYGADVEPAPVRRIKAANAAKAEAAQTLVAKMSAGEQITKREFENGIRGLMGLSGSEAERAARLYLKDGQGAPDVETDAAALAAIDRLIAEAKSPLIR